MRRGTFCSSLGGRTLTTWRVYSRCAASLSFHRIASPTPFAHSVALLSLWVAQLVVLAIAERSLFVFLAGWDTPMQTQSHRVFLGAEAAKLLIKTLPRAANQDMAHLSRVWMQPMTVVIMWEAVINLIVAKKCDYQFWLCHSCDISL